MIKMIKKKKKIKIVQKLQGVVEEFCMVVF